MTILGLLLGLFLGSLTLAVFQLIGQGVKYLAGVWNSSKLGAKYNINIGPALVRRFLVTLVDLCFIVFATQQFIQSAVESSPVFRYSSDYRVNLAFYVCLIAFLLMLNSFRIRQALEEFLNFGQKPPAPGTTGGAGSPGGGVQSVQKPAGEWLGGFSGGIWSLFAVLIILLVFIAPLFPGIEKSIRKLQLGEISLEFNGAASSGIASNQMYKTNSQFGGRAHLLQWVEGYRHLNDDYFGLREKIYAEVLPARKKSTRIALTGSAEFFSSVAGPYLACIGAIGKFEADFSDHHFKRVTRRLAHLTMSVDGELRQLKKIKGDARKAESAYIKNVTNHSTGEPKISAALWSLAVEVLALLRSEQTRLHGYISKLSSDLGPNVEVGNKSCQAPKSSDAKTDDKQTKALLQSFITSYTTTWIATMRWTAFNIESGISLLENNAMLRELQKDETNYKYILWAFRTFGNLPHGELIDEGQGLVTSFERAHNKAMAGPSDLQLSELSCKRSDILNVSIWKQCRRRYAMLSWMRFANDWLALIVRARLQGSEVPDGALEEADKVFSRLADWLYRDKRGGGWYPDSYRALFKSAANRVALDRLADFAIQIQQSRPQTYWALKDTMVMYMIMRGQDHELISEYYIDRGSRMLQVVRSQFEGDRSSLSTLFVRQEIDIHLSILARIKSRF